MRGVRQSISIVDILTCGRFVAVGYATGAARSNFHILLKDIHNNEKAIESLELAGSGYSGSGYHGLIAFTKIIDGHPSILFHFGDIDNNSSVRIWRPYDGKLLDTILELPDVDIKWSTISRDCSVLEPMHLPGVKWTKRSHYIHLTKTCISVRLH